MLYTYQSYPKPSYQIYAPPERLNRRLSGRYSASPYDDMELRDSYYPEERHISPGMHGSALSHGSIPHRQRRRSSSVSFDMRAPPMDTFRRLSSRVIKFKRKGAFRSGLTIGDAQANARLSGNDSYTFHDFNTDARGRINLKIRWAGYPTLTYNIPLDGYGDRVNLETLARRTARSIVHVILTQTNIIPVPWDRVEMLRLEEIAPGTWQPVLAVR
ncbi:hypothetical protein PILCRDRAFT_68793 [Piloderma croceum F 1598]|uniref:DUF6741 domain-containing protein n=1 Tax=Piloderma croceum (strain F 1598) TaxID=765440 RepID=A0A0C3FHK4_PILCF|nr:hypothetical protein PILCRDRAFT_68793 [Piloderma croceum F 1598]